MCDTSNFTITRSFPVIYGSIKSYQNFCFKLPHNVYRLILSILLDFDVIFVFQYHSISWIIAIIIISVYFIFCLLTQTCNRIHPLHITPQYQPSINFSRVNITVPWVSLQPSTSRLILQDLRSPYGLWHEG